MKRTTYLSTCIALLLCAFTHAYTWTSPDGTRTFKGEMKAYDAASGTVTVTLTNDSTLKFNKTKVCPEDVKYIEENASLLTPSASSSSSKGSGSSLSNFSDEKLRAKPDGKEASSSKPVQVFILMGQSNMVGLGKIEGGDGSLDFAVKSKSKYPYLVDEGGNWMERKDVRFVRYMQGKGMLNNEWMKVSGKNLGPEYGIGQVLGNAIEDPVMILKSCIGNRSLGWDLLPPGSEPYEFNGATEPGYRGTKAAPKGDGEKKAEWYAGKQYDDDTEDAKSALADFDTHYPGAKKYEVAGFFFWQGEKDCGSPAHAENYEKNLVRFIGALRKEFNSPKAKFVLGTLGESDVKSGGNGGKVFAAHMAVDGKKGKHPEFKGSVATVFTNPMAQGGSGNAHYGGKAEVYMDVGEAMGKAMVELLKSK